MAIWPAWLMPFNMAKSCSWDWLVTCQLPSSPLSTLEDTTHQADLSNSMSSSICLGTSHLLTSLQPWRSQAPGQRSCNDSITEKWNVTPHRERTIKWRSYKPQVGLGPQLLFDSKTHDPPVARDSSTVVCILWRLTIDYDCFIYTASQTPYLQRVQVIKKHQ